MFKELINPTLKKSNNYAYVTAFVYLGSLSTFLLTRLTSIFWKRSKYSVQEELLLAQSVPGLGITSTLLIHFFLCHMPAMNHE